MDLAFANLRFGIAPAWNMNCWLHRLSDIQPLSMKTNHELTMSAFIHGADTPIWPVLHCFIVRHDHIWDFQR